MRSIKLKSAVLAIRTKARRMAGVGCPGASHRALCDNHHHDASALATVRRVDWLVMMGQGHVLTKAVSMMS
jgi:hypothetical protein